MVAVLGIYGEYFLCADPLANQQAMAYRLSYSGGLPVMLDMLPCGQPARRLGRIDFLARLRQGFVFVSCGVANSPFLAGPSKINWVSWA